MLWAQQATEPDAQAPSDPAPEVTVEQTADDVFECQSCTARHKSLQKLQEARTAPDKSDAPSTAAD